jgi:hypothetical protein
MTTQTIACSACGADVPYGRLSCPSCGELLASVAGARRPAGKASRATRSSSPARSAARKPTDGAEDRRDVEAELPWPGSADDRPLAAAEPAADPDPTVVEPGVDDHPGTLVPDEDLSDDDDGADLNGLAPRSTTTPGGDGPATWAVGGGLTGSVTPRYMPRPGPRPAEAADVAGAVVAPSPAAPAPFRDPEPFAAVGFLLPWARVVIGATGLSYVDRWGLAGQNHVLVVLGVLTLLVLGLVRNPVPVWVRAGIGGLGLGPLLLGLIWPYLFVAALSSGPGIPIVAVGAVALIVAGVLALVADRHGSRAPGV